MVGWKRLDPILQTVQRFQLKFGKRFLDCSMQTECQGRSMFLCLWTQVGLCECLYCWHDSILDLPFGWRCFVRFWVLERLGCSTLSALSSNRNGSRNQPELAIDSRHFGRRSHQDWLQGLNWVAFYFRLEDVEDRPFSECMLLWLCFLAQNSAQASPMRSLLVFFLLLSNVLDSFLVLRIIYYWPFAR